MATCGKMPSANIGFLVLHEHPTFIITTNMASNTSPQQAVSVDFNGAGFILIESIVFEIFGFYARSS